MEAHSLRCKEGFFANVSSAVANSKNMNLHPSRMTESETSLLQMCDSGETYRNLINGFKR